MVNEYHIYLIFSIILIMVICIGLVGNTLNIIVFGRKEMRNKSTFRLLFYLSIIDILVLLTCTTDALFTFGFKIQIRLYSTFVCRFHTFLSYFLSHISSLVLMVVSLDRVFVVYNKSLKYFRYNYIERLILIISIILSLINIHYLFFYNINVIDKNPNNEDTKVLEGYNYVTKPFNLAESNLIITKNKTLFFLNLKSNSHEIFFTINTHLPNKNDNTDYKRDKPLYACSPINDQIYNFFLKHVWIWIDSSLYSFIPIVIMAVCSFLISIEIKRKSKLFSKFSIQSNKNLTEKRIRKNKQILFMLTATNIFFIVCSLPYCIIYHKSNSERTETDFSLTLIIVHILSYTNNSFNFLFYNFFSEKYTEELKLFFCKQEGKRKGFSKRRNESSSLLTNHRRSMKSIRFKTRFINKSRYQSQSSRLTNKITVHETFL